MLMPLAFPFLITFVLICSRDPVNDVTLFTRSLTRLTHHLLYLDSPATHQTFQPAPLLRPVTSSSLCECPASTCKPVKSQPDGAVPAVFLSTSHQDVPAQANSQGMPRPIPWEPS